jgi:hypothetical protein
MTVKGTVRNISRPLRAMGQIDAQVVHMAAGQESIAQDHQRDPPADRIEAEQFRAAGRDRLPLHLAIVDRPGWPCVSAVRPWIETSLSLGLPLVELAMAAFGKG